jgi:hypothetical protein
MDQQLQQRIEALGPAERIIQSLTTFTDHVVHNRPGMVTLAPGEGLPLGVRWTPVIWKEEGKEKVVYQSSKVGKKVTHIRVGVLKDDGQIKDGRTKKGMYRKPGLFPEVAAHYYRQVAEVWKMDNEFAAHWASWAFPREHRDMKVILCAFMLVQGRKGAPVIEDGEILFRDEDYRNVGEAICLTRCANDLNPKLLLRVGDILNLKEIADINRELGFGNSARNPARGRYYRTIEKWLRYREENLPMLEGLVKAGFRRSVMRLAARVGYKPTTPKFFEILRWKQAQSKDGRRSIAIGKAVSKAETWEGMSEQEICELIEKTKPNWKRVIGLLPPSVGMTKAIVAAAVEAGSMSEQDLIILTPTLEELGLLKVKSVEKRWKKALENAENQRAANIAKNVKTKEAKEGLQMAVDKATEKAIAKVTKDLRVYCIVDKSGSMQDCLEQAQSYLTTFLGGFPLDRLHVSVFNTIGTEVSIKAPKAAAVKQAFQGHMAGGGTSYASGVAVLSKHAPKESEDVVMLFVGDEEGEGGAILADTIRRSKLRPTAFGLLRVGGNHYANTVSAAAAELGIPCFRIEEQMFKSDDPYAITRILGDLIASTPVGQQLRMVPVQRKTLVQEILETPLLQKPLFAM